MGVVSRSAAVSAAVGFTAAVLIGSVHASSSGTFTPQNGRIAFTRSDGGPTKTHPPRDAIWSISAVGGDERRLTPSDVEAGSPDFSPDGKLIAYEQVTCLSPSPEQNACLGRGDIWVMNADGSDPRQLTSTARVSEGEPKWSPQGTKIAYAVDSTYSSGPGAGLWVMNSDGTDARRLTHRASGFSWSPDGATIVYSAFQNIVTVPVAGGHRTVIARSGEQPDWSPDGSQIVFVRDGPATRQLWSQTDLWVMNADGSDPHPITNTRKLDESAPAWSPDGRWIVYSRTKTYAQGTASDQLYLIHPDGTGERQLTDSRGKYPIYNDGPAWQPR